MAARTFSDVGRFVGLPYDVRHLDCADLVLLVQRELFGAVRALPAKRPRPLQPEAQALALAAATGQLAQRTELPQDGDLVLMYDGAQALPGHAGTWFFLDFEPWVLHCSNALGESRLHRMRDLPGLGLRVEGVYRWI